MANRSSSLSKKELALFNEGRFDFSYQKFGAHLAEVKGKKGVRFTVWAPNAKAVWAEGLVLLQVWHCIKYNKCKFYIP